MTSVEKLVDGGSSSSSSMIDDFVQEKITKREWINMEMPVGEAEKAILYLIVRGYDNVNIRENDNLSFLDFLKLTKSKEMDAYVFETFFVLNKADSMRIANLREKIDQHQELIVEFEIVRMLENIFATMSCCKMYILNYVLSQSAIKHLNPHLRAFAEFVIQWAVEKKLSRTQVLTDIFGRLPHIFEKEESMYLSAYADRALYDHQRKLFQTFHVSPFFSDDEIAEKRKVAKLVLYIAPTGTGKTMTPVGLCEDYRIIFLCVARHIGLSLAKMAVSVGKQWTMSRTDDRGASARWTTAWASRCKS